MRQAARLLQWHAIVRSEQADDQQAATSLHAMLRLAASLKDQPTLLSHLMKISIEVLACRTIQTAMGQTDLTDEQLARLGSALIDAVDDASMMRALVGERCVGLDLLKHKSLFLRWVFERRSYLNMIDRAIAYAAKPTSTVADDRAFVDAVLPWAPLSGILAPPIEAAVNQEHKSQGILVRTATAIAVRRYQMAHGAPPATLNALVPRFLPAVPRDPSNGRPMRLTVTPTELRISSTTQKKSADDSQDGADSVPWG